MARTREKVIFEVTHSFSGSRPAIEVFADAFAVHLAALYKKNLQTDTFGHDEIIKYNGDKSVKEN